MTIYEFINEHPNDHIRIIRYEPADDIIDKYGKPVCGGEGISTIMFDSTTGDGDIAPDLMMKEVINNPEPESTAIGNVWELEYIPDKYWTLW